MGVTAKEMFSKAKKDRFIAALAETGHVQMAAKAAKANPRTAYNHRKKDAAFKKRWEEAIEEAAISVLEPEAVRRAVHGVDEPVFYQGKLVDTVKKYSDTMLIFLLKGAMREKYMENLRVGGDKENPLRVETTPENRQAEIAALAAELGYVRSNGQGS